MWEVASRRHPYEDIQLVFDYVKEGGRPGVNLPGVPENFISLMQACWSSDPEARPSFAECVRQLTELQSA